MNAYELADKLIVINEKHFSTTIDLSIIMLRQLQREKEQQADRIADLEKENSELKYEKSSNAFGCPHGVDDGACKECYQEQTKPLSDEEIAVIWANHSVPMTGMEFLKVARAILKAQNG